MAIDLLEKELRGDIMRPDAHVLLISSYIQAGEAEMAETLTKEAIELFPGLSSFQWLLAEAYLRQERVEDARNQYMLVRDEVNRGTSFLPLQVTNNQITTRLGQLDLMEAAEAYQNQDLEKAIRFMESARKKLSPSPDILKNLAVLYSESGRHEEGLPLLERSREHYPEDSDFIRLQAMYYQQMENSEEMIKIYEEIVEKNPGSVEDVLVYAQLLFQSRETNKAITLLAELLEKYPKERRIYDTLISFFEGTLNIEGKRNVLKRMADEFPDELPIWVQIAETHELQKEWKEARSLYDSLAIETGDELLYGLRIAYTYESQDSLAIAEAIYENLYESHPQNETLLVRMGANFENQSKWQQAVNSYRELAEMLPDEPEPAVRLGVALFQTDDSELSLAELERAAKLGSDNPEIFLYRSKLYSRRNEDEKALRLAIDALEASFEQLGESQKQMQGQMQSQGFYGVLRSETTRKDTESLNMISEEAFDWFTDTFRESDVTSLLSRLLEKYPLSAKLFSMTGNYHMKIGNRNRALRLFEEAVRLAPKLADAHFLLGELYNDTGDTAKAIRSYRRSLSLSPEWPEPYRALIRTQQKKGNLNDLCDRWLAMYRSRPHNEVLRSSLIEALHKANRFSEAAEIINNRKTDLE